MIPHSAFLQRQTGAVLVIVALSLFVIMGMAGLALDLGHLYLNKTRLQNAVDAAALAGARTLNDKLHVVTNPGNPAESEVAVAKSSAIQAAQAIFFSNLAANNQLSSQDSENAVPTIEFSNTLFNPATSNRPLYVRVSVGGLKLTSWFIQVLAPTATQKFFSASAVAGITPVNCPSKNSIVPLMLCANGPEGDSGDADKVADADEKAGTWGYTYYEKVVLKDQVIDPTSNDLAGNFQILDLGCSGNSADCIRTNMAGGEGNQSGSICEGDTTPVELGTAPGNRAGPIAQGLNTRFGIYEGNLGAHSSDASSYFPADDNKTCYDYSKPSYDEKYVKGSTSEIGTTGIPDPNGTQSTKHCNKYQNPNPVKAGTNRRVIAMPIVDCANTGSGNTTVKVLHVGCFFLNNPADSAAGNLKDYCIPATEPNGVEVCGSFVKGCIAEGGSSNTNEQSFDLLNIQLYKDPFSNDS